MKWRSYSAYQPSGVDWADVLPLGWRSGHLQWLAKRYAGGTPDKSNLAYWTDGTIPWIGSGEVNQKTVTEPTAYITEEAYRNSSTRWVPKGALLMALAGQGKTKGMVAQMAIEATCNQSAAAIVPTGIEARYLYYWLEANYRNVRGLASDDLRDGLNLQLLGGIGCPLPSRQEQRSIVATLDREAAKLDTLIAKQERLIELLQEKRQAVISHAVAKGLDPKAPMKDSGVQWLGKVPVHWECGPLKRFCEVVDCKHYTVNFIDEGRPIVSIRELREDRLDLSDAKQTSQKDFEFLREGREPRRGDLILCRNASVGAVGFVDTDTPFCMGQDVCLIRTRSASRYMHYQLTSPTVRLQIEAMLVGATIRRINVEQVRELLIAHPPVAEQQRVADRLNDGCKTLDTLIERARRSIDLMREHRSALISAAVTGKIDVREAA